MKNLLFLFTDSPTMERLGLMILQFLRPYLCSKVSVKYANQLETLNLTLYTQNFRHD